MGVKLCRDCGAKISFRKIEGRWRPFDLEGPGGSPHRCPPSSQVCRSCEAPFSGQKWQTLCPTCYRSQKNVQDPPQGARREPEPREKLREDVSDKGVPF